jgi:hypothetical protein
MKQTAIDFTGPFAFDPSVMAVAPSPHRDAKETSALAAIENAQTSRKAVQNTRILSLIKRGRRARNQRHRIATRDRVSAVVHLRTSRVRSEDVDHGGGSVSRREHEAVVLPVAITKRGRVDGALQW